MKVIPTDADFFMKQEAELNCLLATQSRDIAEARAIMHPAEFDAIAERAFYHQQAEVLEAKAHARAAKLVLDQIRQR